MDVVGMLLGALFVVLGFRLGTAVGYERGSRDGYAAACGLLDDGVCDLLGCDVFGEGH